MPLAVAFFVAPDVAAATAAARTVTRQRATMLRLFIWKPPESGGPVARSAPWQGREGFGAAQFGTDQLPLVGDPRTVVTELSIPPAGSAGQRGLGQAERLGGHAARPELGDEPVAVAAVRGARVLDHVAGGGAGDALEEQRRRVERDAERLRLLFIGDGRLDRLRAADDLDAVAAREQVVERVLLQVRRREPRDERLPRVQELDRHRLAVGEPEALDNDDCLRRGDVQDPPQPRPGRDDAQLERPACRPHAALAHLVAEGADHEALCNLRLVDEGSGSAAPDEVALADQIVQRGPNGQA